MQSTYTPGNLTTVIPGMSGAAPWVPGGDSFMAMAETLFKRRQAMEDQREKERLLDRERALLAAQQAKRMTGPSMVAEASKAPLRASAPMLGSGVNWQDDALNRRMQALQLQQAEERSRPAPTKTLFSLNASSNPNGPARVIDWTQASIGNMPSNGGFSQSAQEAAAGDQMVSGSLRDRFDASTAAGQEANATGKSPAEIAFEQQLKRIAAARR